MFCSNCGNSRAPGEAACAKCGAPVGAARQTVVVQQIANASLVYRMSAFTFLILALLAALVAQGLADQGSEEWAASVYAGAAFGFLLALVCLVVSSNAKKREAGQMQAAGRPDAAAALSAPTVVPLASAPAPAAREPAAANLCPSCGKPLTWSDQYKRWFCQAEGQWK